MCHLDLAIHSLHSVYPARTCKPYEYIARGHVSVWLQHHSMLTDLNHSTSSILAEKVTGDGHSNSKFPPSPRSSSEEIRDSICEKRVWRKLDMFILPTVGMFFLLSFLVSVFLFSSNTSLKPADLNTPGPYQRRKC
jgi:hypothetical protein